MELYQYIIIITFLLIVALALVKGNKKDLMQRKGAKKYYYILTWLLYKILLFEKNPRNRIKEEKTEKEMNIETKNGKKMSNEKKYANGLFAKKIEFQNGGTITKLSIKVDDFVSFLEENEQNGWVNLDLKVILDFPDLPFLVVTKTTPLAALAP